MSVDPMKLSSSEVKEHFVADGPVVISLEDGSITDAASVKPEDTVVEAMRELIAFAQSCAGEPVFGMLTGAELLDPVNLAKSHRSAYVQITAIVGEWLETQSNN